MRTLAAVTSGAAWHGGSSFGAWRGAPAARRRSGWKAGMAARTIPCRCRRWMDAPPSPETGPATSSEPEWRWRRPGASCWRSAFSRSRGCSARASDRSWGAPRLRCEIAVLLRPCRGSSRHASRPAAPRLRPWIRTRRPRRRLTAAAQARRGCRMAPVTPRPSTTCASSWQAAGTLVPTRSTGARKSRIGTMSSPRCRAAAAATGGADSTWGSAGPPSRRGSAI
mmetsp:Transcript_81077/g.227353  ORF Transcript_81077/g.227353 Transcript_81077/m.227353 type:complete len:224 (-) Transcript_81077:145-816(-)